MLTLVNTPLDLQITICVLLHPSDILALRKTCRALEHATRQRIVWVAVLHRVCLDNTLFLPSFPISDMSERELERAAMRPRRWIELCDGLQKEDPTFCEMLHSQTTRNIEDAGKIEFFIVPGGRYLVTAGDGLSVWDLGYVSTVDCKLVASVGLGKHFRFLMVQATPDGRGLVILLSNHSSSYQSYGSDSESYQLSIFEIYPQSEIPLLTQIAHFSSKKYPVHLLPDTIICRVIRGNRMVFRVVDYRTNYSICFTADVILRHTNLETLATKTAIIVLCNEGILIWAIPPLSPQLSDFPDYFRDDNPTLIPPLFKIPILDIARYTYKSFEWETLFSWYFGFEEETVYFDMRNTQIQRFKIIIKADLSDASLHVINMPEIFSDGLKEAFEGFSIHEGYRICDDALVYSWNNRSRETWGTCAVLISAPFIKVFTEWDGQFKSLCPASGRFVCRDREKRKAPIVVVDLF